MGTNDLVLSADPVVAALVRPRLNPFHHEAFFYANDEQYLRRVLSFIEEGLEQGEPVMVAVPGHQHDLIADHVRPHELFRLENMEGMGRNPAWIIPAWHEFAAPLAAAGRPARGIGEPIWASRSREELAECCRHEHLLNLAFADAAGFTLLCPYNLSSLPPEILDEAMRNHPTLYQGGVPTTSTFYRHAVPSWLSSALPATPVGVEATEFDESSLPMVRDLAAKAAADAGLSPFRIDDLLVVVREVATNSVLHGGGAGTIAFWRDGERFVCELKDRGCIDDPLAGRVRPSAGGGRGLWLINQMCDLVQLRYYAGEQTMRLHMALG